MNENNILTSSHKYIYMLDVTLPSMLGQILI